MLEFCLESEIGKFGPTDWLRWWESIVRPGVELLTVSGVRVCVCACAHLCVYLCACVCVCLYACPRGCVCICVCYVCPRGCMCICAHARACVYLCVCVCVCVCPPPVCACGSEVLCKLQEAGLTMCKMVLYTMLNIISALPKVMPRLV